MIKIEKKIIVSMTVTFFDAFEFSNLNTCAD